MGGGGGGGFEIFDFRIFLGGKILANIFLGSSDNVRQIKGFGGVDFGPGIFGEFCLKPEGFFGVVIFAPI